MLLSFVPELKISCHHLQWSVSVRVLRVAVWQQVLLQDVQSYQRVIDSISDKAQNLVQASSDPQLARFVSQTSARYQKLSDAAKVDTAGHCIRRIIK